MNHTHAWLYRRSHGRVGARVGNQDVLLLTTVGRRSGRRRTTPIQYQRLDGKLVVVAANGGYSRPPAWWLNLQAEPNVRVQLGAETSASRARTAGREERGALWPLLVENNGWLPKVELKAGRELPLVLLEDLASKGQDAVQTPRLR